MASLLGFKSVTQPCVLLIVLVLLQCGSAQMCSFWESGCIDPLAQTAVPMDFSPLFPDPITFYYAFDELPSGKGQGPVTKTSYWLRYHDRKINQDQVTSNRTSEIALRVGNLTGTPSGTTNGCDGIWGNPCSQDIKGALQHSIFRLATSGEYYSKPLEAALAHMMAYPPHFPNCGAPIFDVASIPVQGMSPIQCHGRLIVSTNQDSQILPKRESQVPTSLPCLRARVTTRGRFGTSMACQRISKLSKSQWELLLAHQHIIARHHLLLMRSR